MLKALFGSAKDDPLQQAIDHFHKLRNFSPGDPAYNATLLMIVRLSQLTIQQRKADGDAHVLLANAYLLAAFSDPFGEAYPFALARAAAAIYHWKTVPMHTKEGEIGEKIFRGVENELAKDRPSWMGPALPNDISQLHQTHYEKAKDPTAVEDLSRLLTQDD